jgi:hypothetical protein
MPMEFEREQALLQRLHDRGDSASLRDADGLQKECHVRQMDGLSQDVYQAAKGEGKPPPSWRQRWMAPNPESTYTHLPPRMRQSLLTKAA